MKAQTPALGSVGPPSAATARRRRNPCFRRAGLGCAAMLALALLPAGLGAATAGRFTRLLVEQGLSQSTVQAILQDHAGFIWFGTEEGLNRYDGYTFVIFKHSPQDPGSLPDDLVTALYEDRQKLMWVGTEHGLCLFDRERETFTRIPSILDRVTSIVETLDGTLWVGAEGGGLFLRNPATGEFASYQPDPKDPASLVSFGVSALLRDHSGRLWIGTRNGGVDRFEPSGQYGRFVHHRRNPNDPRSLANDEVWGLAEDSAGNLWVATYGGGLSVLDHKTGTFRHYRRQPGARHSLPTDLLTCVLVDRSGTLWVGTDGAGLLQYDAATDEFLAFSHDPGDPTSLSKNVIRTIYEDVQGQLWAGTFLGGVNLLKKPRRAFGYFTHAAADPSSLSDPAVASFLEDAEGNIWIGTEQGWLNRFDHQTGAFIRYRFPSQAPGGSAVLSLHRDRQGRIWVGSYRGGLALFDPRSGSFRVYKHRPGDPRSLGNDEVWAITEDKDGALWLGTNAGVDRFDPNLGVVTEQFQAPTAGGLSYAGVRSLLYDREGNLWVGNFGGLIFRGHGSDSVVRYQHDDADQRSLTNGAVVALHEDRQGRLWVGTLGGGLNRFDPDTGGFTSYKEFPSNVIYGIREDNFGHLWVSTNHGLARFDPETGSVESFDLTNGLQSLQFHLGASLKTRSGRMLFGSTDGFYYFDPESIKPDTFAPPVVITSLRIFNEPVKFPTALLNLDQITLSYQDKVFSFEFAALDYTFPRRNRYSYRMEGFSDHWIELGAKREVTFTNLDPGTYVFRVRASNSDGVWSETSAGALRVMVRPPFWSTWWFEGGTTALVVFVLLAAHRIRVRRLKADIAERKRAEQAIRASEESYRSLFQNSPISLLEEDFSEVKKYIDDLRARGVEDLRSYFEEHPGEVARCGQLIKVLQVNKAAVVLTEASSEEDFQRGLSIDETFIEETLETLREEILALAGGSSTFEAETVGLTLSGRRIDLAIKLSVSPGCEQSWSKVLVSVTDLTERKRAEEALRQEEERFRYVSLATHDAIYDWDIHAGTVWRDDTYQALYSPSEPIGTDENWWESRIHPDDRQRVMESVGKAFREKRLFWSDSYRFLRADGDYAALIDRGYILYDPAKSPVRMIGAMTDITEHKRVEEALRESEERYRALYDDTPSMYFTVDPDGTVLSVNKFGAAYLGYTTGELIGQPVLHIFLEGDRSAAATHLAECVAHPERVFHWKLRKVRRDGNLIWVKETARAVRDRDGKLVVLIVCEDITERTRAEEELRQSAEEISDLYNNAPCGYHSLDHNGTFIRINDTALNWLGYSRDEVVGKMNITDLFTPENARDFQKNFSRLKEHGSLRDVEFAMVRKDGTTMPVLLSATAIRDADGNLLMTNSTLFDITERKRLEEQLQQSQKLEAVGRLAGGVAHDFNNLLTAILGYSDLTLEFLDRKDPLYDQIDEIRKAAERAASLTSQLLAFSRRQILQPIVLDLNSVVSDMEKMLRRLIGEDIELRTVLGAGLGRVKADPSQMEQVIMNLAVNARDAMPQGGKLTIETANADFDEESARRHALGESGRFVMVAVSDTGHGMNEETRRRIFEPFFTTKEKGKGTGLGLSTVYGIVNQSEGNIWVYSEVGKGTSFKIYLPRVEEEAEAIGARTVRAEAGRGNETILLVEDEPMVRRLASSVLKKGGYTVLEAPGGGDALLHCERYLGPIHLLITDVVMPQVNGRELAERIAPLRPEMKVLYMSGYTDDAISHHGILEAGAHFVQKPFTPDSLLRKVREVLDRNM